MRRCAITLVLMLVGCRSPSSTSRPPDLGVAFDEAVEAYTLYVLPNSMAQPEGTDLDALQKQRLRRFEDASKVLHSAEGVAFLDRRLSGERDDLVLICGIHVLEESGQPAATAVIRRYVASPEPTVAVHANAALANAR